MPPPTSSVHPLPPTSATHLLRCRSSLWKGNIWFSRDLSSEQLSGPLISHVVLVSKTKKGQIKNTTCGSFERGPQPGRHGLPRGTSRGGRTAGLTVSTVIGAFVRGKPGDARRRLLWTLWMNRIAQLRPGNAACSARRSLAM